MSDPLLFIMIVGPSGTGKSTVARQFVSDEFICEADTFPNLYVQGVLQSQLLQQAHQVCKNKVEYLMSRRIPTIVQSNTNLDLGEKGIKPYVALALHYGYEIHLLLPSYGLLHYESIHMTRESQLKEIIANRSIGDKIVPPHVVERMIQTYESLHFALLRLAQTTDPSIMYSMLE